MSTFSAQDQSKMSFLFAPFGYLVSTSCLDQFIQPPETMEVISTTKGGQKLCFECQICQDFL